ncbi:Alpha/beta hydrolase family protein [Nocardioides dokdonensis FR1436]|uniref:Alpha/beta hydrolase family protein n=1 Tax=Nocardioides dokdonensis FR1436 TaxID=1300347 RepID=A0A1A9GGL7_9ACTN|nr:alpha/beta hydrolase [Nocardioides dokdonensis]ANH36763.1 Alpha/beta hydrolase family protein [Nocardioides dokdonensis FR1436]
MSTVLLVHGAFCRGWVWEDTVTALRKAGHRAHTLDLPSSGAAAEGLGDLQADADAVRQALAGIDDDVVLVAHSGGGMVLTELADHPRVSRSVYVAALWPQKGQSVGDLLGGELPGWIAMREDGAVQVAGDPDVVRDALCLDVDQDRFLTDLYPRYVLTSLSSIGAPSTAPSPSHPSSYVICEQDHAVPPEAQEAMAGAADHVHRLPSSHSPMLSMPQRLAEAIAAAA